MSSEEKFHDPTINEELGFESTNEARHDHAEIENEGIVSVNRHGRTASGLAAKIAFLTICLAIFTAGGLTYWNKHRVAAGKEADLAKANSKVENKPAAIGKPREFTEEAPAPEVKQIKTADGGIVKVDTQGYVVPEVQAGPLDANAKPIALHDAQTTARTDSAGQPVRSRYSGEIIVTGGNGSMGGGGAVDSAAAGTHAAVDNYTNALAKILDRNGGQPQAAAVVQDREPSEEVPAPRTELGSQLSGTQTAKVSANTLGDRSMVLAKGKSIDCTLTSRIISELPGFVTCELQSNVYSDDGRVVLLEKGSEATGEFGNTVAQGQHRIFVLWDRIKTPKGVLISLNSPGTDSLGTSGLPGYVDNRWFERIGSAFMLSFIKDAIAYKIAEKSGGSGAGTVAFQNTSETGDKMTEKVLESTINLKPVLYKNQGETLAIFVARDLDFGSVYKLSLR